MYIIVNRHVTQASHLAALISLHGPEDDLYTVPNIRRDSPPLEGQQAVGWTTAARRIPTSSKLASAFSVQSPLVWRPLS